MRARESRANDEQQGQQANVFKLIGFIFYAVAVHVMALIGLLYLIYESQKYC